MFSPIIFSQEQDSPFDSRPKIARSPSARKNKLKLALNDSSKPSSDTSESGKETPSPRAMPLPPKQAEKSKEFSNEHKVGRSDAGKAKRNFTRDSLEEVPPSSANVSNANFDESASSEEGNDSLENTTSAKSEAEIGLNATKVHTGLSKSALERMKARRSEEIRKRELSLIKQKEKEIEERLRAERAVKVADEWKKAEPELEAEVKRLEDLIKQEEVKAQEEFLEKKRKEEKEKLKEEEISRKELQVIFSYFHCHTHFHHSTFATFAA